jgi:hypothetical protein
MTKHERRFESFGSIRLLRLVARSLMTWLGAALGTVIIME